MSLPARKTNYLSDRQELEITAELLLTLSPAEAPHMLVNETVHKATVYRWVVILEATREGHSPAVAAGRAGMGDWAIYEWLRRGQAGEYPFDAFWEAYSICRATAEERHLNNIMKVALDEKNPQWTASAWYLERTRPEKYSRRQVVKQDQEKPKEFTIIVDQTGKIAERLEQRGREIEMGDGAGD